MVFLLRWSIIIEITDNSSVPTEKHRDELVVNLELEWQLQTNGHIIYAIYSTKLLVNRKK